MKTRNLILSLLLFLASCEVQGDLTRDTLQVISIPKDTAQLIGTYTISSQKSIELSIAALFVKRDFGLMD